MTAIDEAVAAYEAGDTWRDDDKVVELAKREPLDRVIPVRLSANHWRAIQRSAQGLGIGASTLVRMWVLERISQAANPRSAPAARIPHERSPRPASRRAAIAAVRSRGAGSTGKRRSVGPAEAAKRATGTERRRQRV